MPDRSRVKAVLAKTESTYGTDSSPAAGSDEVQVEENFYPDITIDHLEDNIREGSGSRFGVVGGQAVDSTGQFGTFQLLTALKGRSSAFSASNLPEIDAMLRACGLEQSVDTTSGSETVTYTPRDTGLESATIYLYTANKEYQFVGCFGTVSFIFTPGQIARARFEFSGLVGAINETGLPGSLAFPASSVAPPTVKSAGLTINSFDPDDFQDFQLDMGVEVVERPGGNATDGHAGYHVGDIMPTWQATYETGALGTHDPYSLRDAGTEFSWDLGPMGPAQYNMVKVSGPAGRITGVENQDNSGIAQWQVQSQCRNSDASSLDSAALAFS